MQLEKDNFPSLVVGVFMLRKTGTAQIRWQWPAHFLHLLSSTFWSLFHICWLVSYPSPYSLPVKIGAIFQGLAPLFPQKSFLILPAWLNLFFLSCLLTRDLTCMSYLTLNHILLCIVHCIFKPICLILVRLKSLSGQGCLFYAYRLSGLYRGTYYVLMIWNYRP